MTLKDQEIPFDHNCQFVENHRSIRSCALTTLLTYEYMWIELIEDHSLQVYAVNNFGIGSPGVMTFHIPKGLLSNTSHL